MTIPLPEIKPRMYMPHEVEQMVRAYGDARAAEEREKIMVELRQALQDDSNVAAIRALAQS